MKMPIYLRSTWLGRTLFVIAVIVASAVGCTNYDADTPDTAANKAGFERHFGFAPPSSVTDIYYYATEVRDATYQLGFSADQATIDAIIAELELTETETSMGFSTLPDFDWWVFAEVEKLPVRGKTNAGEYWYLWYDAETGRAYYLEFSI